MVGLIGGGSVGFTGLVSGLETTALALGGGVALASGPVATDALVMGEGADEAAMADEGGDDGTSATTPL